MHLDFLSPRVERIDATGKVDLLHEGGALGRYLRRPVVLIARELCSFALFEATNLPRRQRGSAARLHARFAAPYLRSGYSLIKAGTDFGLWWWDEDQVERLLGPSPSKASKVFVPETLAQPRGQAWRIVRLKQGYEAQLWRGQSLIASAYRQERFDAASWSAFVRLQRDAPEAPAQPPAATDLPIAFANRDAFAQAPIELTREQLGYCAAGAAVVACLSLSAYFYGQGRVLESDAETLGIETQSIRASTPQPEAVRNMDANQKALIAYHQIEGRTNPLTSTGAAIGILALHDLVPDVVDAKADGLSLTLAYEHLPKVQTLIADFETSGYFFDIMPRADAAAKTLVLEMKVHEAAPPLIPET